MPLAMIIGTCRRPAPAPPDAPTVRVASLVPAATDLLMAMGCGDMLAAVSNYDQHRAETSHLPRVGDYQSIDWERLRLVRPTLLIVQMAPQRVPAGMRQRAEAIGARLLNIQIERLADVSQAIRTLGDAVGRPDRAQALADRLAARLNSLRTRTAGLRRVPALLVVSDDGLSVVGPHTFLDDLLEIAGGANVAGHLAARYPSIDREMLLSLRPEAVIQLLPAASPAVVEQARRNWNSLPTLSAGRVHILTDWYLLLPGSHVADVATKFAEILHGEAVRAAPVAARTAPATRHATRPGGGEPP